MACFKEVQLQLGNGILMYFVILFAGYLFLWKGVEGRLFSSKMFCSCGFHAFLQICLSVFLFFSGLFHGFGERCSSLLFTGLVRDGYLFSKEFHVISFLFLRAFIKQNQISCLGKMGSG